MENEVTKTLAAEAVRELADYVANAKFGLAAVTKQLTKLTGRRQYPSNVAQWLARDPENRMEPRFGVGLLLLRIQDDLRAGKWPIPEVNGAKDKLQKVVKKR